MRSWVSSANKYTLSGFANDVIHDRLYFGDNGGGASTINANDKRVFVNPVGEQTVNISTGGAVLQTEAETSLEGRGGTIPNGEAFVITSIGINIKQCNWQATTPFTSNSVTSINITPIARVNPQPLMDALLAMCTFELYRNSDQRLERGNIVEYPCPFGQFVAAGGAGASVPALAGGAQNAYVANPSFYAESGGSQGFRELTVYNVLQALDDFYGVFKVNREIALASTLLCGYIDFYLVGRLAFQYEADQYTAQFGLNA